MQPRVMFALAWTYRHGTVAYAGTAYKRHRGTKERKNIGTQGCRTIYATYSLKGQREATIALGSEMGIEKRRIVIEVPGAEQN